jgi:hypothetical protein
MSPQYGYYFFGMSSCPIRISSPKTAFGIQLCGISISICEKTTTLIFLDLQLVLQFIVRKTCTTISVHLSSQSNNSQLYTGHWPLVGARGRVLVKALCYKPEGHGFDTR